MTVVAEGEDLESHAKVIPLVHRKTAMGGKTTAYVCVKGVCELPTNDPKLFDTVSQTIGM